MEEDFQSVLDTIPEFGTPYIQTEIAGAESGAIISVWSPLRPNFPTIFKSHVVIQGDRESFTVLFEINASTLEEAIDMWREAAQYATKEYNKQIISRQLRELSPAVFGATH